MLSTFCSLKEAIPGLLVSSRRTKPPSEKIGRGESLTVFDHGKQRQVTR